MRLFDSLIDMNFYVKKKMKKIKTKNSVIRDEPINSIQNENDVKDNHEIPKLNNNVSANKQSDVPSVIKINAIQIDPNSNNDVKRDETDTHEKTNSSICCKDISYITRKLKQIRDQDGQENHFPLEEYNYFIESVPSQTCLGRVQDDLEIPSELITLARKELLKSKPKRSEKNVLKQLTYRFYCSTKLYDKESSYLLNQCLRSDSKCFENAKKFLFEKGYSIVNNKFF